MNIIIVGIFLTLIIPFIITQFIKYIFNDKKELWNKFKLFFNFKTKNILKKYGLPYNNLNLIVVKYFDNDWGDVYIIFYSQNFNLIDDISYEFNRFKLQSIVNNINYVNNKYKNVNVKYLKKFSLYENLKDAFYNDYHNIFNAAKFIIFK